MHQQNNALSTKINFYKFYGITGWSAMQTLDFLSLSKIQTF